MLAEYLSFHSCNSGIVATHSMKWGRYQEHTFNKPYSTGGRHFVTLIYGTCNLVFQSFKHSVSVLCVCMYVCKWKAFNCLNNRQLLIYNLGAENRTESN